MDNSFDPPLLQSRWNPDVKGNSPVNGPSGTLLLFNEFRRNSSPVSQLVDDLLKDLRTQGQNAYSIHTWGEYSPGGTKLSRIFNMLVLHVVSPWIVMFFFLRCLLQRRNLVLVVTTSPPLLYMTTAIIASFLRCPIIVWYMDALPTLFFRSAKSLLVRESTKLFLRLESYLINKAAEVVVLDHSMARNLERIGVSPEKMVVAPPWVTFIEPAEAFKPKDFSGQIQVIYAGNYGRAHDLAKFARSLNDLGPAEKARVRFTFVGMDQTGQTAIKTLFRQAPELLSILPRFSKIEQLFKLFDEAHFGLVSLADVLEGVACPSKALTYVSRGLPIIYDGPTGTLADRLTTEGWGLRSEAFFSAIKDQTWPQFAVGKSFESPRQTSRRLLSTIITHYSSGVKPC